MRFNHIFKLTNENETHREYKCDNVNINIDFISGSALRVAVFNDNAEMLPTFTVNPNNNLSSLGRNRLSVDGFDCVAPVVEKFENKEKFVLDCGVTVDLDLNNFILSYSKESKLLFADRAPLAYNFEGEFGNGSYHYITREDDEHIFGLGDKSGLINKAGQVYRVETADSMGFDAEKQILCTSTFRFIFAKILLVLTVFITIQQTPLLLIWAGKSIIITAISSILRRMTIAWFIMFFRKQAFCFTAICSLVRQAGFSA